MNKIIQQPTYCFTALLFVTIGTMAHAKTMTAICSDFNGPQIDYFTHTISKTIRAKEFIDTPTKLSKAKLILIWKEHANKAQYILSYDPTNAKEIAEGEQLILAYDNVDQKTFVGLTNGSPVMLSIYPLDKVAIYSQQSVWSPYVGQGVRAFMFHSKCNIDLN